MSLEILCLNSISRPSTHHKLQVSVLSVERIYEFNVSVVVDFAA